MRLAWSGIIVAGSLTRLRSERGAKHLQVLGNV
jgi:hypothetical protein